MVRTATLDLGSRGSFVDDLNSKPGIVIRRDALLHRSDEIQPAFFDSEEKESFSKASLFSFFFFFFFCRGDLFGRAGVARSPPPLGGTLPTGGLGAHRGFGAAGVPAVGWWSRCPCARR